MADSSLNIIHTSLDHPRLNKTDAESIQSFLRLYDRYATDVIGRARHIVPEGTVVFWIVRPDCLKLCVNTKYL